MLVPLTRIVPSLAQIDRDSQIWLCLHSRLRILQSRGWERTSTALGFYTIFTQSYMNGRWKQSLKVWARKYQTFNFFITNTMNKIRHGQHFSGISKHFNAFFSEFFSRILFLSFWTTLYISESRSKLKNTVSIFLGHSVHKWKPIVVIYVKRGGEECVYFSSGDHFLLKLCFNYIKCLDLLCLRSFRNLVCSLAWLNRMVLADFLIPWKSK